jgi:hypothetical protein
LIAEPGACSAGPQHGCHRRLQRDGHAQIGSPSSSAGVPTIGARCRWERPGCSLVKMARQNDWGSPGPRLPQGPRRLVVGSPTGGPDTDRSWGAIRFPPHLQVSPESPTYTPRVDASPRRPTPTVSPVTPTPIYDQLRGERINAEVPATGADPHRLDHPDGHRLAPTVLTAPAVAFSRSPLAGTDRATSWSWFTATTPAAQPAINPTAPAEPGRETPLTSGHTRRVSRRAAAKRRR